MCGLKFEENQKIRYSYKIAPVVKWISLLSSEQSLWVRILPGAQATRKPNGFWVGFKNLEHVARTNRLRGSTTRKVYSASKARILLVC